ncbi:plant-specific TFIIB-related protein PTF2 [Argentina anserina]|uniref:plant-specific TFIIB-related protein PTF2 n=1 Tax=Argentina anserina TaxID=57926 RepID=UPI00217627AF|nr:plant-specific TFIIB-related protein PTF2 [Potentilla anserina]
MPTCASCNSNSLSADTSSGRLCCSDCGLLQDFDNLVDVYGGVSGPTGTFIRLGTSGEGTNYQYRETKIYEANKLIDDVTLRLNLAPSRGDEIKAMIGRITEGEFGQGNWFNVLIGACAYVIMRKDSKSLPIAEVAAAIGCDDYELGRMIMRVVDFLELKKPDFPEFDIVRLFERTLRNSRRFSSLGGSVRERMRKQGIFLVQCCIKWFLTTGRRPLPVVVAVLVLVAELNGIGDVSIQECAKEVNVVVNTCRLRYRELLEALVKAAQVLPWGKDVNVKNVLRHAPTVIQYMEKKCMLEPRGRKDCEGGGGIDLRDVVRECLGRNGDEDECATEVEELKKVLNDSLGRDKMKLSHECLAMVYSKSLDEMESCKSSGGFGAVHEREERQYFDPHDCTEWWNGKSELSKKLMLKNILEKDVGLDPMPPSYDKGLKACKRRRERINAAKHRIHKIMHPSKAHSDACISEDAQTGRKRKRKNTLDWEDLIIETLLLHQVKEDEIEKGWYNNLLDLHVFNSGVV